MPPLLAPADTTLRRNPQEPLSYQLYDTFEDYLSPPIEERLREMNQAYPIKGLSAFVSNGEITKGQWVLYTQTCLVGQITNGGVAQFIDNCPGLILDAEKLLSEFGPKEMQDAYSLAAQRFLDVIGQHARLNPEATGDDLDPFWADLEAAWRDDDEERFQALEDACYAPDRNDDASNWFTQLEKHVLDWVLENPGDFVAAS
ncbi:MAG: DUF4375 domain-containing protein [Paracoccaceae bacterium]|nr:DUF4375 domain-containing protein [Paracoccaceae bacterium]